MRHANRKRQNEGHAANPPAAPQLMTATAAPRWGQYPLAAPDGFSAARRIPDLLLRVVDAGLMGILFVAPYFMGGRYPVGRLVFVSLCVLTAGAWCVRALRDRNSRWIRTPADWIVPAGVLLVLAQLIPLPAAVLAVASPQTAARLPLWNPASGAAAALGTWSQISLAPRATLGGLAIFLAYGMLFLVTVQRIGRLADVETILKWIGFSAVMMAGFGLVQYLWSNGKFFWYYEHPFRTTSLHVLGSFINRNHFTHLLALGLGPVLLWVVTVGRTTAGRTASRGNARPRGAGPPSGRASIAPIALAVLVFAGLMSLSRGGAISMGVALVVFGAVMLRSPMLDKRQLLGGLGIAALLAAALSIHGYDRVAHRLDDLRSGSLDRLDRQRARRQVWAANLAAVADYPVLGTGVGSHREVHPMYRHDSPEVEYTHAENGYLQVASETGVPGLLLLLAGIGIVAAWCFRTWRCTRSEALRVCLGAVAAGLAASLVHSLVDFVWYIPACMSFTVVLAACAARLWHFARDAQAAAPAAVEPRRRPFWLGLTGVTLVAGIWMVGNRLPPALASPSWDRYLRASLGVARRHREELRRAQNGHAAVGRSVDADAARRTETMVADLKRVVAWCPTHARAHLRLAGAYLGQFDRSQRESHNAMDLSQIRDAAVASRFPSRKELDRWLVRAFGPDVKLLDQAWWHTRRGLQLCPMQGEGYLFLAELCFLEGATHRANAAYLDQALRLRPHDERVCFAAGKEAALAGDLGGAVDHWKQCFHARGSYQLQLIQLLAGQVPVSFFQQNFAPQLADLQLLYHQYRRLDRTEEMGDFCAYYLRTAAAETGALAAPESARIWLSASRVCNDLQQPDKALACADTALRLDPNNYHVRHMQGVLLMDAGRFEQAEGHLRWCLLRKPGNNKLRSLLEVAVRSRLERQ